MSERARISSLTQRVAAAVAAADTQKLAVKTIVCCSLSEAWFLYAHVFVRNICIW